MTIIVTFNSKKNKTYIVAPLHNELKKHCVPDSIGGVENSGGVTL